MCTVMSAGRLVSTNNAKLDTELVANRRRRLTRRSVRPIPVRRRRRCTLLLNSLKVQCHKTPFKFQKSILSLILAVNLGILDGEVLEHGRNGAGPRHWSGARLAVRLRPITLLLLLTHETVLKIKCRILNPNKFCHCPLLEISGNAIERSNSEVHENEI